jgi:5'-deoxynucleotidase YfbR-like HD superfamily hydrolase
MGREERKLTPQQGEEMKTPICKLMDAQYIKRWSIVGTMTENTLPTHSFNVAMLAMELYNRMPEMKKVYPESQVCYYALIHDIGEVYTGDIPTPTKVKMKQAGLDINTFDMDAVQENHAPAQIQRIIKAADLLDNYMFIEENAVGPRARDAIHELHGRLLKYSQEADESLRHAIQTVYYSILGRILSGQEDRIEPKSANTVIVEKDSELTGFRIVGGEPQHISRNT